jgi:pyruvate dehydrogenase E2 component (dihydrolipoamide acetyltransferase)
MSLLHRSLLAQIMAAIDPVVEAGVAAFVPGGAAIAPLVKMGMEAGENVADSVSGGGTADAPAAPAPTAPAAPVAPAAAPVAAPAAPAPTVADLVAALSAVLAQFAPK